MKQKIIQTFKLFTLVGFLFIQFFGFNLVAQAAGSVTFSQVKVSSTNVKDGDTLRVTPFISTWSSNVTPNNTTMQTFVNGQKVGNNTGLNLYDMQNGGEYQDIPVSTQSGFKNGTNYINVTIIGYDGSNYGNMNAPDITYTGSGSATPPSGGTPGTPPGGTGTPGTPPQTCTSTGNCTTGGQVCVIPTGQTSGTCQTPGMSGNSASQLYNPLPEEDLTHVFLLILQGFLGIIGIWAVMFVFIGGFQMVMAAGDEERYTKAKKTITWAILGLIVALLSFSIIAIVQDVLQANIKTSVNQIEIVKYL